MMKINVFKLLAYGPFADKVIDFSKNGFGLHVIFGPNETGKSTALRALIGLLFGFGHKVEDAWLHDYNKLAVRASLGFPDGKVLNLTRYKRRKNDLINDDTGEPIVQSELDLYLGKMDREAFEHAFGISHDSLRQGVESVLAAGGDLGHALFAATSGLNTLKQVMAKLEVQQNQLFAPRAQKAVINARISQFTKLRKEQRDASASHRQWKLMQDRLDALQNRKSDVEKQLAEATFNISLFTRYQAALTHVAKRIELQDALREIGPVPDLSADFSQRRVQAQVELKRSEQAEKDLGRVSAETQKRIEQLSFEDNLVGNATAIEALATEATIHAKAIADSVSLKIQTEQLYESAEKSLAGLRAGLTLTAVGPFKLSKPDRSKITRLGGKRVTVAKEVTDAQNAHETAGKTLEKAKTELEKLGESKDTGELKDCLARALEFGNLEQRIADEQAEFDKLVEQAMVDIQALGLWQGNLDELEKLPVPAEETMRRFELDLSGVDRQIEDNGKELAIFEDQLNEKQRILEELSRENDLPSLEDLRDHRSFRDKGWQSVRSAWLDGADPDMDFIDAFPDSRNLAEAYEQSVVRADQTADVLREDADAVAKAEGLRNEIRTLKQSLKESGNKRQAHNEERSVLWNQWQNIWDELGVSPLMPREMAGWATRVGDLKRRAADIRERKARIARIRTEMDGLSSDFRAALDRLGETMQVKMSYSALLDLAKRTDSAYDKLRSRRQELENRIENSRKDIVSNQQRQNKAKQDFEAWLTQWAEAVQPLDFGADSDPEEVSDFILALDDVFSTIEKAAALEDRIATIKRDYAGYSDRVFDVVDKLVPDLNNLKPEEATAELNVRLTKDREHRMEYQRLVKETRKNASQLADVRKDMAAQREILRQLCMVAKVDQPDDLPAVEKKAKTKTKVVGELVAINERLAELAAGEDLDKFADKVKKQDPDELQAKLEGLEANRAELKKETERLTGDIAVAERELESIGGESRAAEIAEKAEGFAGQIQTNVQHYVRLKLASLVLAKSIERYREANQSPVLEAASSYFKTITTGNFEGLRADFDERGDPVLKALRPNSHLLTLHQMSDGSRDQLFLALRLGGLARYVKANGLMPFIVDDVLVHFDDDRSAAALAALSELANDTQVVFFTHHKHLVNLAESLVPDEILSVHQL